MGILVSNLQWYGEIAVLSIQVFNMRSYGGGLRGIYYCSKGRREGKYI